MNTFTKEIRLDHLKKVELEDWAHVPAVIESHMMGTLGVKMDSAESMVFALQLQHLRAQDLERPYPELKARQLIPQQSESSPGDEEYAYIIADQVGMFDLITNYADDLPVTDVKGEKKVANISTFGGAVHYSIDEIEKSNTAGRPLPPRKMKANRDIAERKFERIAWLGDVKSGAFGMLNHPNITKETAGTKAAGGTAWAVGTAEEIYKDLVRPIIQQTESTNEIERPDNYVMTLSDFERANSVFFSDASGESALARFKKNYPEITITTTSYMKGNGAGGTNVLLAFKKDPNKVAMESPLPYNIQPPQFRNLATIINARMKTAGVIIFFPLSVTVIEGL